MKYNSFDELEKAWSRPLAEDKYEEALTILEKGAETLPKTELKKHLFTIMDYKCWFFYECKKYEQVIKILTDTIENGFSCPLYAYKSVFKSQNEETRYIELKEKNDLLRREVQKRLKFEYIVYVPKGYDKEKKYPLFFNFHGDGDNTEYHKKYWKPDWLISKGFIVVYVQSSQLRYHNSYVWIKKEIHLKEDDGENGSSKFRGGKSETYSSLYEEFKHCYNQILNEYSVDEKKIVIGGFSGGAMAVIDIAIADIIPIKGAIALCSLKPKTFTQENIKMLLRKSIKLVFMEGEKDIQVKDVEEMMEDCKNIGIPYEYYINEGIGHWYPEDLDDKLEKALSFIFEQSI
ncbi:MAG: hypothetical protein RR636_14575 [Clostridium sp.]|uniref:hypothetical protein n=1 Tax=Clostridium sp. TaxID=1506 RepID=UPI003048D5F7